MLRAVKVQRKRPGSVNLRAFDRWPSLKVRSGTQGVICSPPPRVSPETLLLQRQQQQQQRRGAEGVIDHTCSAAQESSSKKVDFPPVTKYFRCEDCGRASKLMCRISFVAIDTSDMGGMLITHERKHR
jgi:hypothetical protein